MRLDINRVVSLVISENILIEGKVAINFFELLL